jgi:hypothetical protein
MSALRRTRYQNVPRPGESNGSCRVTIPIRRLMEAYSKLYLAAVLAGLRGGEAKAHDRRAEEDLDPRARDLSRWFMLSRPKLPEDPKQLLAYAESLTDDEGAWKDRAEQSLQEQVQEAQNGLRTALEGVLRKLEPQGPAAVNHWLNQVRDQLQQQADKTRQQVESWTLRDSAEIQNHAHLIRRRCRPSSRLGALGTRLLSAVLALVGFPPRPVRVERRLVERVLEKAERRLRQLTREYKLRVFEHFLGSPHQPGLLDTWQRQAQQQAQLFADLASAPAPHSAAAPPAGNHIELVSSLGDTLDRDRRVTVGGLVDGAVRRAGRGPARCVQMLRRRGLTIHGRKYLPHEWGRVALNQVRQKLQRTAACILQPALESAAAELHLMHPAFHRRLLAVLNTWRERSRPYVALRAPDGMAPQDHVHLFCYPPQRGQWHDLLATFNLVPVPAEEYRTSHPFVAILFQSAQAVPPGALAALPLCLRKINDVKRDRKFRVLFDPSERNDIVHLHARPVDHGDSEGLFEAGLKAAAISRISPDGQTPPRYVLSSPPTDLVPLFAPARLSAESLPALDMPLLLRDHDFVAFGETMHADFRQIVEALKQEHDAERVAEKLVKIGILEASPGSLRYYRAAAPAPSKGFPGRLFRQRPGPLVGLTQAEFVAALLQDDQLYTVLFGKVITALDLHQITTAEVPAFLRQYAGQR